MALSEEEIKDLKAQLAEQIKNLSSEKKAEAQKQIDSLSPSALEAMLKQQQAAISNPENSIFRLLVSGQVPAVKVGENSECLAVLDINPISKGHCMIIPKNPVQEQKDIPKSAFFLAEELSKKMMEHLKAKSTKAEAEKKFGESILHLIPIYDKELSVSSKRSKSTPEELQEVKKSLETIKLDKKPEIIKQEKPKKEKPLKLSRKIP